jgi:hypothetical protein
MTIRSDMLPIATKPRGATPVDVPTFSGRGAEAPNTRPRLRAPVSLR